MTWWGPWWGEGKAGSWWLGGSAEIMWRPSPVCRRLRPFGCTSSWLNVKKEQRIISLLLSIAIVLITRGLSLKENEHFTHSYLQVRVKGVRHLCLLSIHPHLLPKCSVAHKVLVWNKKSGVTIKNCWGVTGGKWPQTKKHRKSVIHVIQFLFMDSFIK